jgi:hypothetical protein
LSRSDHALCVGPNVRAARSAYVALAAIYAPAIVGAVPSLIASPGLAIYGEEVITDPDDAAGSSCEGRKAGSLGAEECGAAWIGYGR